MGDDALKKSMKRLENTQRRGEIQGEIAHIKGLVASGSRLTEDQKRKLQELEDELKRLN